MGHRHDDALRERIREHFRAFERQPHDATELRRAAVAVALAPDEDGRACFVITVRAAGLRNHGGQWALPGGRLDPGEEPIEAALRERGQAVEACPSPREGRAPLRARGPPTVEEARAHHDAAVAAFVLKYGEDLE